MSPCDQEGVRRNKCPLCEQLVCYVAGDWHGHADDCYVSEYRKVHARGA